MKKLENFQEFKTDTKSIMGGLIDTLGDCTQRTSFTNGCGDKGIDCWIDSNGDGVRQVKEISGHYITLPKGTPGNP